MNNFGQNEWKSKNQLTFFFLINIIRIVWNVSWGNRIESREKKWVKSFEVFCHSLGKILRPERERERERWIQSKRSYGCKSGSHRWWDPKWELFWSTCTSSSPSLCSVSSLLCTPITFNRYKNLINFRSSGFFCCCWIFNFYLPICLFFLTQFLVDCRLNSVRVRKKWKTRPLWFLDIQVVLTVWELKECSWLLIATVFSNLIHYLNQIILTYDIC